MGKRRFVFTGSGEPFLHQNALQFKDLISHAGCSFAFNTNGTLLDREIIDAEHNSSDIPSLPTANCLLGPEQWSVANTIMSWRWLLARSESCPFQKCGTAQRPWSCVAVFSKVVIVHCSAARVPIRTARKSLWSVILIVRN